VASINNSAASHLKPKPTILLSKFFGTDINIPSRDSDSAIDIQSKSPALSQTSIDGGTVGSQIKEAVGVETGRSINCVAAVVHTRRWAVVNQVKVEPDEATFKLQGCGHARCY